MSDATVAGAVCGAAPPAPVPPTPAPTPTAPLRPTGLRCLDPAAHGHAPQAVRMVFAGSSTTQTSGYGYVAQLVELLRAGHTGDTTAAVHYSPTATFGALSTEVGLHAYNVGEGSTTSATYLTADERTRVAALAPSVVLHMIGANDFATDMPVATYKANVQAAIADLQAKTSTICAHVLVQSYARFDHQVRDGTRHPWAAYGRALAEIAAADPGRILYVDASGAFLAQGVPGKTRTA